MHGLLAQTVCDNLFMDSPGAPPEGGLAHWAARSPSSREASETGMSSSRALEAELGSRSSSDSSRGIHTDASAHSDAGAVFGAAPGGLHAAAGHVAYMQPAMHGACVSGGMTSSRSVGQRLLRLSTVSSVSDGEALDVSAQSASQYAAGAVDDDGDSMHVSDVAEDIDELDFEIQAAGAYADAGEDAGAHQLHGHHLHQQKREEGCGQAAVAMQTGQAAAVLQPHPASDDSSAYLDDFESASSSHSNRVLAAEAGASGTVTGTTSRLQDGACSTSASADGTQQGLDLHTKGTSTSGAGAAAGAGSSNCKGIINEELKGSDDSKVDIQTESPGEPVLAMLGNLVGHMSVMSGSPSSVPGMFPFLPHGLAPSCVVTVLSSSGEERSVSAVARISDAGTPPPAVLGTAAATDTDKEQQQGAEEQRCEERNEATSAAAGQGRGRRRWDIAEAAPLTAARHHTDASLAVGALSYAGDGEAGKLGADEAASVVASGCSGANEPDVSPLGASDPSLAVVGSALNLLPGSHLTVRVPAGNMQEGSEVPTPPADPHARSHAYVPHPSASAPHHLQHSQNQQSLQSHYQQAQQRPPRTQSSSRYQDSAPWAMGAVGALISTDGRSPTGFSPRPSNASSPSSSMHGMLTVSLDGMHGGMKHPAAPSPKDPSLPRPPPHSQSGTAHTPVAMVASHLAHASLHAPWSDKRAAPWSAGHATMPGASAGHAALFSSHGKPRGRISDETGHASVLQAGCGHGFGHGLGSSGGLGSVLQALTVASGAGVSSRGPSPAKRPSKRSLLAELSMSEPEADVSNCKGAMQSHALHRVSEAREHGSYCLQGEHNVHDVSAVVHPLPQGGPLHESEECGARPAVGVHPPPSEGTSSSGSRAARHAPSLNAQLEEAAEVLRVRDVRDLSASHPAVDAWSGVKSNVSTPSLQLAFAVPTDLAHPAPATVAMDSASHMPALQPSTAEAGSAAGITSIDRMPAGAATLAPAHGPVTELAVGPLTESAIDRAAELANPPLLSQRCSLESCETVMVRVPSPKLVLAPPAGMLSDYPCLESKLDRAGSGQLALMRSSSSLKSTGSGQQAESCFAAGHLTASARQVINATASVLEQRHVVTGVSQAHVPSQLAPGLCITTQAPPRLVSAEQLVARVASPKLVVPHLTESIAQGLAAEGYLPLLQGIASFSGRLSGHSSRAASPPPLPLGQTSAGGVGSPPERHGRPEGQSTVPAQLPDPQPLLQPAQQQAQLQLLPQGAGGMSQLPIVFANSQQSGQVQQPGQPSPFATYTPVGPWVMTAAADSAASEWHSRAISPEKPGPQQLPSSMAIVHGGTLHPVLQGPAALNAMHPAPPGMLYSHAHANFVPGAMPQPHSMVHAGMLQAGAHYAMQAMPHSPEPHMAGSVPMGWTWAMMGSPTSQQHGRHHLLGGHQVTHIPHGATAPAMLAPYAHAHMPAMAQMQAPMHTQAALHTAYMQGMGALYPHMHAGYSGMLGNAGVMAPGQHALPMHSHTGGMQSDGTAAGNHQGMQQLPQQQQPGSNSYASWAMGHTMGQLLLPSEISLGDSMGPASAMHAARMPSVLHQPQAAPAPHALEAVAHAPQAGAVHPAAGATADAGGAVQDDVVMSMLRNQLDACMEQLR